MRRTVGDQNVDFAYNEGWQSSFLDGIDYDDVAGQASDFTLIQAQASTTYSDVENTLSDFDLTAIQHPFYAESDFEFARVRAIVLRNKSTTTPLLLSGGGSNKFPFWWGADTTITLGPSSAASSGDSLLLFSDPSEGIAVSGSAKTFRLRTGSGTANWEMLIVGFAE